ncbi:transporter substrate-binding domain-containing protein [Micropruina sp.]|jgi:putative amino-acid transport system substrate-binding protein|uniref:transporter substrate-binding domain-containing protein n=1 Tax=Micropruina sp. TaxID=2737536 RepID=UPI00260F381C|nr:transporter substrate-binding domain-containing protein [Micropruina sp.]
MNTSRRTLILGSAAAFGGILLSACSGGTGGSGEKVIRAGSTGQSYPNGFREGDKLVGYDVELLETAAKDLGYTVQWTTAEFSGIMGQLEAGRLDTVANNVAVTAARKEKFDFTATYAYLGAQVVTKADNTTIKTLEDLAGKTVSGVLGSDNLRRIEDWGKEHNVALKTRPYETRDAAMQDMIKGQVDAYINSDGILHAEEKREGKTLFNYIGDPIGYDEIALPFTRNTTTGDLRTKLSEVFEKMRGDGRLKALSEKYYGTDVTTKKS